MNHSDHLHFHVVDGVEIGVPLNG